MHGALHARRGTLSLTARACQGRVTGGVLLERLQEFGMFGKDEKRGTFKREEELEEEEQGMLGHNVCRELRAGR